MSFIEDNNLLVKGTPVSRREQAERALFLLGDQLREVEEQVRHLREEFEQAAAAIRAGLATATSGTAAELAPASPDDFAAAGGAAALSGERSARSALTPAGGEGDEDLHREAARYARLLVAEIELYNAAQVSEGRAHKDLYSRLQPQIDRSRKAYEGRYGPSVLRSPDYFHEELVRTLAGGDASLLGPAYPGPSA